MSLPTPSPRNVEIYQLVTYEGHSLRQVATQFELSANRVVEIVQQVERWYRESTPEWAAGCTREQQAIAAWRLHGERLQHLYCQTMQAWRASQGEQTIEQLRLGGGGATSTTMKRFGEVRYLAQASRISRETAQAAVSFAKLPAHWFDPATQTTAESAEESPTAINTPPTRVLAREELPAQEVLSHATEMPAVNVAREESCDLAAPLPGSATHDTPLTIDPVRLRRKQRKERRRELERVFSPDSRRAQCVG